MIDPLKYSYYLVLVTEKKKKYDITNFVEDLGWEELENELAARLSCTVKNDKTTKGRISSLSKPGCYLYLYYRYKTGTAQEAMRGRIVEWNPSAKSSSQPLKLNSSVAISNRISTIASAIRSGSMTSEDFCNSLSGHGSCYSCKFYLDSKFLFL